jgi:hypothetical protein
MESAIDSDYAETRGNMTRMVLPTQIGDANAPRTEEKRLQITVHVQAEVLDPQVARRKANTWLLMNAGNLLGAENPELILDDTLLWRFDVRLTVPRLDRPGTGVVNRIGQIHLDAVTGEVMAADTLVDDLRAAADALIVN